MCKDQTEGPKVNINLFGLLLAVLLQCITAQQVRASGGGATITKKIGKVRVLINPQAEVRGNGPHVKLGNFYYTLIKGKRGMKIPPKAVIQTGRASRAQLIYPNGDQLQVSSFTSYVVDTKQKSKLTEKKSVMKIFFGAVRATIEKTGPRNDMEVKTTTMSMGVRGTDFHVAAYSQSGGSEVTILRGKVAVKDTTRKDALEVIIPKGFSAKIQVAPKVSKDRPKDVASSPVPIKLEKTTKEKLVEVQKTTVIKSTKEEKVDPALAQKLEALEKKAVKVVMNDIKDDDPALYQELQQKGEIATSIDKIQTVIVKKAYKQAPKAIEPSKPDADDLDMSDEDVYQKYFD